MKWLVHERGILGFGTETIGTDAGQGHHFDPPMPAHHFLHGAGRYGLQCLRNLDQLPPTGSVIVAAPLKIENGSGSPLEGAGAGRKRDGSRLERLYPAFRGALRKSALSFRRSSALPASTACAAKPPILISPRASFLVGDRGSSCTKAT